MDNVVKVIIINLWLTFIFNRKCLTVFIVIDVQSQKGSYVFRVYLGSK